jgi:hypothetical protein
VNRAVLGLSYRLHPIATADFGKSDIAPAWEMR